MFSNYVDGLVTIQFRFEELADGNVERVALEDCLPKGVRAYTDSKGKLYIVPNRYAPATSQFVDPSQGGFIKVSEEETARRKAAREAAKDKKTAKPQATSNEINEIPV